jgi:hypothetical protein
MAVAGFGAGTAAISASDRDGAAFIQTSLATGETSGTATFVISSAQTRA